MCPPSTTLHTGVLKTLCTTQPPLQDAPRRKEILQRSGLKSILSLLENNSGGVQGEASWTTAATSSCVNRMSFLLAVRRHKRTSVIQS